MKPPLAGGLPQVERARLRPVESSLARRILAVPRAFQDAATAIGLFGFALLIRLPFRTEILYHWDSVNFAYAMLSFDLAREQPHPPGYIVYVWLARLVNLWIGNESATLVTLSVSAGALAVAALYLLGERMYDRQTGLLAALFLAVSPLFWFYSEIALPHTLDAAVVLLFVLLAYGAWRGDIRQAYLAAVVLSLAGGLRPQTLVFMLPVLLYALKNIGLRHFLAVGAVGVLICLLWFVPLTASAGGVGAYFDLLSSFASRFQRTTSVLMGAGVGGVLGNARKLAQYTLFGWGAGILPPLLGLFYLFRRRTSLQLSARTTILLLWLGPVAAFYLLVHMGQQGLVFVYLPVLFLLSARGLLAWKLNRLTLALAALVVAGNALIFLVLPEFPLGAHGPRLLTRSTLERSDRYYQARFDAIRTQLQDEPLVILASSWHHIEYYLPTEAFAPYGIGTHGAIVTPIESTFDLGPDWLGEGSGQGRGEWRVVLFDPPLLSSLGPGLTPQYVHLDASTELAYLELEAHESLSVGPTILLATTDQP